MPRAYHLTPSEAREAKASAGLSRGRGIGQLAPDEHVMALEHIAPASVSQRRGVLGRADDVREEEHDMTTTMMRSACARTNHAFEGSVSSLFTVGFVYRASRGLLPLTPC